MTTPSPPDWRGLCEELANHLQGRKDREVGWPGEDPEQDLLDRARALLAQPEPEVVGPPDWRGLCELVDDLREQASQGYCEFISREDLRRAADLLEQLNVTAQKPESDAAAPSDEELLQLAQHHSVSYTMSDGTVVYPLQHGCDMRDDVLSFARAVLSCWGRPAPAPAGEVDPSQLSDGYHTFAELYEHRHALMLALMRSMPGLCWFSERHADGEMPFGSAEWFIAGAQLPTGSITYHLPSDLLQAARQTGATELPAGKPWDGHTAADVVKRLQSWAASPHPAPAPAGERQAAPVPVASDVYFEFVVSDADYCTQAGGIAPTYAQALSEGQHYLAQCQQDGPHTLELRRVEVLPLLTTEPQP